MSARRLPGNLRARSVVVMVLLVVVGGAAASKHTETSRWMDCGGGTESGELGHGINTCCSN